MLIIHCQKSMYLYPMFNRLKNITLKKLFSISILLLIVAGCQEKESNLTFETKSYTSSTLDFCKENICPEIEIERITAIGNQELADTINNAIEQLLIENLTIDPDESSKISTLEAALENFTTSYRSYKEEFPDASAEYVFTSKSSISSSTDVLLSMSIENYSYWGGAHGYGSTSYLNFDKSTGKTLSINDLIKNQTEFLKLAETKFKKQKGIAAEENINSTGYFFENDEFILPANVGFNDQELLLVYNPYEVASYAEGQIIITLPFDEVKEYLSIDL